MGLLTPSRPEPGCNRACGNRPQKKGGDYEDNSQDTFQSIEALAEERFAGQGHSLSEVNRREVCADSSPA